MTYHNIESPEPVVYLIEEAFVTYKGNDYRFWVELDTRVNGGEVVVEFIDGEPTDDFDFDQFYKDCDAMINDFDAFKQRDDVESEE